jgi:hypothetical protein
VKHDAAENKQTLQRQTTTLKGNIMKVEILGLAHATFNGTRGEAGGAPSKDSIFGLALVQGNVVTFGGRRGGTLRFKTYKKPELEAQKERFAAKLTGNPFGKNIDARYSVVTDDVKAELLGADFDTEVVGRGFYKAMSAKKLNTYSRKPKATAAA